jgi:hypothetical protein
MSFTQVLLAIPIWWLNGLLSVLYWLAGHLSDFCAILAALVILFGIDPMLHLRAAGRPRRYDRGEVITSAATGQTFTLGILATWLVVSLTSKNPVPMIGAVMWWIGLVAILAVSEERINQSWWAKIGILVYAALVLALRWGMSALNGISPVDWASVVGSSADAQVALESTRGNVATLGMVFVFVLYPLGYAGLLLNRFFRNPKPLYNTWMEAGDVIRRLRTRV